MPTRLPVAQQIGPARRSSQGNDILVKTGGAHVTSYRNGTAHHCGISRWAVMSDMRTSSVVPVPLFLFQGLGTIVDVARKVIRLGNTREDVLSCFRGSCADRLDAKQSSRSAGRNHQHASIDQCRLRQRRRRRAGKTHATTDKLTSHRVVVI